MELMKELDEEGVSARRKRTLKRRVYTSKVFLSPIVVIII